MLLHHPWHWFRRPLGAESPEQVACVVPLVDEFSKLVRPLEAPHHALLRPGVLQSLNEGAHAHVVT